MIFAYPIRGIVDEAAVAADVVSLRFFARGLFRSQTNASYHAPIVPEDTIPQHEVAVEPRRRPSLSKLAQKIARHRKALLATASIAVAPALGLFTIWMTYWPELESLRLRMEAVPVSDTAGVAGGVVVQPNGLTTHDASGTLQPRVTIAATSAPADFLRAARTLEGEGVMGVNPANLLRGFICLGFSQLGVREAGWLRLREGRCPGGSTLAMQSVRATTDENDYTGSRKLDEIFRAIALNVNYLGDQEGYDRFIVDTLHFGYSRGKPLYGVHSVSMVMFGKPPKALELHESLMLASSLLNTVALDCRSATQTRIGRFEAIRSRAIYALDRGFRDDPRYNVALEALREYSPITSPTPGSAIAELGLTDAAACRAGAHPLLQLEGSDSSARLAASLELEQLRQAGYAINEIRLATDFADQVAFKQTVDQSRLLIAQTQRHHWQNSPTGEEVIVLAFSASLTGNLTGFYESSAYSQLYRERDLGSLAKLPALAFLAEQGWSATEPFCNRSSPPLTNAGGDRGVANCIGGRGQLTAQQVFGRSVSLAVLDALRHYPEQRLRQRLEEWGFVLPEGVEPAYAVAFGLVRTTPARMSAFVSALSAGISGREPVGFEPRIIGEFRTTDGLWHRTTSSQVSLRSTFRDEESRSLISSAVGAAFEADGTLAALGPALPGSVGKSGTLDDQNGLVRFKGAAGGLEGHSWFAMAVPASGPMGDSAIGILPIARSARDSMLSAMDDPIGD